MARLSKSLRFEILARDGFKCRYCGAGAPDVRLEIDHVVPTYRGGKDEPSNLVAACADCNAGKSDRGLLPMGDGFELTPDRRPARMAKIRKARENAARSPHKHLLDTGHIDDLDEMDDDSQLALVWCAAHQKYEWHYVRLDLIGSGAIIERTTRPGWKG